MSLSVITCHVESYDGLIPQPASLLSNNIQKISKTEWKNFYLFMELMKKNLGTTSD